MTSMKEMRNLVGKLRESSYNSKKRKEIAREILEGRSLWGKVKNSFRDNWRSLCFAAAPFLTLGLLYEGTPHLIQKTVPLEYRDMNQDGIEDGIVVFPIHRSNGAIIGWVDGRKYPDPGFGNSKGEWYSEPMVVYRWDINKFIKGAKISNRATLSFSDNHPMRLDFHTGQVVLSFVLAPRIEQED